MNPFALGVQGWSKDYQSGISELGELASIVPVCPDTSDKDEVWTDRRSTPESRQQQRNTVDWWHNVR